MLEPRSSRSAAVTGEGPGPAPPPPPPPAQPPPPGGQPKAKAISPNSSELTMRRLRGSGPRARGSRCGSSSGPGSRRGRARAGAGSSAAGVVLGARCGSAAPGEMVGRAGGRGGCVRLVRGPVPAPRLSELLWTGRSSGSQRTLRWRCPLCGEPRPLQAQTTPPEPALCRHRPHPLPGRSLQAKATPLPDPPSIGEGLAPLSGPPSADIGHAPPPIAAISPAETRLLGLQPRPRPSALGLRPLTSGATRLRGAFRLQLRLRPATAQKTLAGVRRCRTSGVQTI